MEVLVLLVLVLSMTGHSDAAYCVCRSDVADTTLQKSLDYACGAGADCTPIIQNGACYQPNTVRAHCSYAVNSYFQKKSQTPEACVFSNTAQVTQTDPSPGGSCVFPASASGSGGTPTGGTPTGGTSTTPIGTTPPTGTTSGTTPIGTTPTGLTPTTPIMGGGIGTGLGPTGSGISDSSGTQKSNLFSLLVTLWFSGLVFWLG